MKVGNIVSKLTAIDFFIKRFYGCLTERRMEVIQLKEIEWCSLTIKTSDWYEFICANLNIKNLIHQKIHTGNIFVFSTHMSLPVDKVEKLNKVLIEFRKIICY